MDINDTEVPGQVTLPGLVEEMGFESTKLDARRERFCWEYIVNGGYGGRAYLMAYPDCTKKEASEAAASRLLRQPKIRSRIAEIKEEIKRRYRCTAEDVIEYHSKVLKIDRREFIGAGGKPKSIDEIDSIAASILEFDCQRDPKFGTVKVLLKVPTRHQSAVELAKIMGMNEESLVIEGDVQINRVDDMARLEILRERIVDLRNGNTGDLARVERKELEYAQGCPGSGRPYSQG